MTDIAQAVIEFIGQHPHWAGILIFLIALTESVAVIGLFIPGSPILIGVGAVVGLGHLPLWPMLVWATAGAILGDGASYELGRRYRDTILGAWPMSRYPGLVARGETFFRRHGGKSIALGRFLPMLRPMIPMVAGALGLRPGLFYAVNIASAIVWAPAHILGGAVLGASLGALGAVSGRLVAMLAVLALTLWLLVVVTRWVWRRLLPLLGWAQHAIHRWAMARGSRPAHLLARLADPEEPDLRVMAALGIVVLLLVAGFVNLLRLVAAHGGLARADGAISAFVQGLRTPWGDAALTIVTMLGDGFTITVMVVAAIAWLLLHRAWHRAGGVAIAIAVTAAFVPLVKGRLQIARPTDLYSGADAFSFPSGHAAFSAVLYGILGWLVARGLPGRWQLLPLSVAAALIGLVCASRVYLAAHWPSDVTAGLIFGLGMTVAFAMAFRRADPERIRSGRFAAALLAGPGHRRRRPCRHRLPRRHGDVCGPRCHRDDPGGGVAGGGLAPPAAAPDRPRGRCRAALPPAMGRAAGGAGRRPGPRRLDRPAGLERRHRRPFPRRHRRCAHPAGAAGAAGRADAGADPDPGRCRRHQPPGAAAVALGLRAGRRRPDPARRARDRGDPPPARPGQRHRRRG